jgi:hypothetical protein
LIWCCSRRLRMHCRGLQKLKTAEGKVEKLRVGGRIL